MDNNKGLITNAEEQLENTLNTEENTEEEE